jgi:hypothetical protein
VRREVMRLETLKEMIELLEDIEDIETFKLILEQVIAGN